MQQHLKFEDLINSREIFSYVCLYDYGNYPAFSFVNRSANFRMLTFGETFTEVLHVNSDSVKDPQKDFLVTVNSSLSGNIIEVFNTFYLLTLDCFYIDAERITSPLFPNFLRCSIDTYLKSCLQVNSYLKN